LRPAKQKRSGVVIRGARALIWALALHSSFEDFNRLDDLGGSALCPFRSRSNQELGRHTRTELLQRTAKCLLELQLSLDCHGQVPKMKQSPLSNEFRA
jgi:hypothetical protein